MSQVLGLIAGSGKLPAVLLAEAKKAGYRVALCGITGEADPAISESASAAEWIRMGQLGRSSKLPHETVTRLNRRQ